MKKKELIQRLQAEKWMSLLPTMNNPEVSVTYETDYARLVEEHRKENRKLLERVRNHSRKVYGN